MAQSTGWGFFFSRGGSYTLIGTIAVSIMPNMFLEYVAPSWESKKELENGTARKPSSTLKLQLILRCD